jgi:hypothetical protein
VDLVEASARGKVEVIHQSKRLLRTRVSGPIGMTEANKILDVLESWMGDTKDGLVAFHDGSAALAFEPGARQKITAWSNAHIEPFAGVHILVGNRATAWAIRVLVAILGAKVVAHHSMESFDAAFQKVRRSQM